MAETSVQVIKKIYECFQRGDIPGVMERIAEDVEWGIPSVASTEVPWHGVRRGRQGALSFFQALGANCEFPRFEFDSLVSEGNQVYATIHFDVVIKKNGKRASMDALHYFVVRDGRVTKWTGTEDTAYSKALWNA